MVNCGYFLIYSYSAIKVLEKPIDYVCTCTSILKCVCIWYGWVSPQTFIKLKKKLKPEKKNLEQNVILKGGC